MWVRPAYDRDVWPDGDDRRLVNLAHYRIVRVTAGGLGPRAAWAVEAIVETADRNTVTSEMQGRTALLAVVATEARAAALLEQVQAGLAAGRPCIDLRDASPGEDPAPGP